MPDSVQTTSEASERHTGAASTALSDLLTGAERTGYVLGVTPAAAYLVFPSIREPGSPQDQAVVALETATAVGLPNAVTLGPGPRSLGWLRPGMTARIGHGVVSVGPLEVRVARWRDPRPRLARTTAAALSATTQQAAALLPRAEDPLGRRIEREAVRLAAASVASDIPRSAAAVEGLLGLGLGSTPSGDDVLAGFLAAGRLLGEALAGPDDPVVRWFADLAVVVTDRADGSTNVLSADLLRHARHGGVAIPAAGVLHALTGREPLPPALERLYAVGHSSGRDLALGMLHAAETVVTVVRDLYHARQPLLADSDGRPL